MPRQPTTTPATARNAPAANAPPARPSAETPPTIPARDPSDPILISPRVLDSAAFEQFSGSLRALIAQADERFEALRTMSGRAEIVVKRVAEAGPALEGVFQSRIAAAGDALGALDARASAADALLARALDQSRSAAAAQDQADTVHRDHLAEVGRRLSETASEIESRITAARSALTGDLERAETRADRLRADVALLARTGLGDLEELCSRAAALLGRPPGQTLATEEPPAAGSLADAVKRAETLKHEADFATRQLAEVRRQADAARTLLAQSLAETSTLIDQVTEKQAALRESLKESLASLETAEGAVRERLDAAKADKPARQRKAG